MPPTRETARVVTKATVTTRCSMGRTASLGSDRQDSEGDQDADAERRQGVGEDESAEGRERVDVGDAAGRVERGSAWRDGRLARGEDEHGDRGGGRRYPGGDEGGDADRAHGGHGGGRGQGRGHGDDDQADEDGQRPEGQLQAAEQGGELVGQAGRGEGVGAGEGEEHRDADDPEPGSGARQQGGPPGDGARESAETESDAGDRQRDRDPEQDADRLADVDAGPAGDSFGHSAGGQDEGDGHRHEQEQGGPALAEGGGDREAVLGSDRGNAALADEDHGDDEPVQQDRKSTRLNSSHANISYAVF